MADTTVKQGNSVSRFLSRILDRTNLGVRAKLIIIFFVVKVLPLIILTVIAWNQIVVLGDTVQKIAVNDATDALNDSAVESIERMTTDTAQRVADFLYERDNDALYAATLEPNAETYASFISSISSPLIDSGAWALSEDGMSWVQVASAREPGDTVESSNSENLDNGGWHSRPADGFSQTNVPIFDEITFIDVNGVEQFKAIADGSTKKLHPMSAELKDVSKRENTYLGSEDYWESLKTLKPGELYVSDVKGAYVPSHFIGMYTPKQMVITAITGLVTTLEAAEDQTNESAALQKALIGVRDNDIAKIEVDAQDNEAMMQAVIAASLTLIDDAAGSAGATPALAEQVSALKEKIAALTFDPENEAYAGEENPLGKRFEGIVRWATPVSDGAGGIAGYVTLALNHDHIMEFVDHQTPMSERYTDLPSAFEGNYAFIWDYNCRAICHPRHHSIYGFDPETGLEQIPWLETSIYEKLLARTGSDGLDDLKKAWPELVYTPEPTDASGVELLIKDEPVFDSQSRAKKPASVLTAGGLVGLDGRYLNNAPQCTGWMDLTKDGGSGSFYILWSGLYKLTTAAAIPYYTGQYAPSEENGWSKRGFAMVTIGAGLEDFTKPAQDTGAKLTKAIDKSLNETMLQLVITSIVLILIVILIAIWLASWITNNITRLIRGIARFRAGERQFRFNAPVKDEFGLLADSFDDMAESIVDSVKDPMSIIDINHKIIYINEAGLALNDYKLEDVTGQPYGLYSIYPEGTEYDPIRALENGLDTTVYYSESKGVYVKGIANWFYDMDGNRAGIIILSKDVTDEVTKRLELEEAVTNANIANMHKSDFLARMSHEIRTPMNAIIGITNIALNKFRGGVPDEDAIREVEDYMLQIKTNSRHLLGLLNDILDISKINAGKIEVANEMVDFVEVAKMTADIIKPRCDEKGIAFNVKIDDFSPSTFMSDELTLRQVLINLLGNAVKFTHEGGRIDFIIENLGHDDSNSTDCDASMTRIKFTIRDTGIGISDEEKDKIFEPFEQAVSEASFSHGGSGLGLAISRRMVELMGSHIELESEVGKGSEFTFTLCLEEVAETNREARDYSDVAGRFADKRALIVDDIEINRLVVVGLLEETGIATEEAEDGLQAVEKFRSSPDGYYDIIFMDVQMPHMDGHAASSTIRAMQERNDAKNVVIIALTANAFKEDVDEAKASGMNAHVAKPVDADKLIKVLLEYVDAGNAGERK
ncbi:MAG: response regulator [Clostridiales Family XIII bacterium]|jgi:signal transduction histidine kinase/CheY-like chemotaxis protein/methyl-accepting chemotaxis protein|nr:response regulator [Clostridiales Family XIII bacterium]